MFRIPSTSQTQTPHEVLAEDRHRLSTVSKRDKDKSEFYKVDKDPLELNNLYGKPEYSEIQQQLTRKIQAWQREVDDIAPLMGG